jgi:DNA-binding CsgD family transcriptional regulator
MSRSRSYQPRNIRRGDPLTPRELQVLALVAAGETTPAISKRLGILENTIKTHLTSVYKKTGSANRVQATRYYLRRYTTPELGRDPAPPPTTTAPISDEGGGESLIAHQIRDIQDRLEQLAPAASEAQRLQRAIDALREIEAK